MTTYHPHPKQNNQGAQMPRQQAAGKADWIVRAEMIEHTLEQVERLKDTPAYLRWQERLNKNLEVQYRRDQARMASLAQSKSFRGE